jgi:hypothetical protein
LQEDGAAVGGVGLDAGQAAGAGFIDVAVGDAVADLVFRDAAFGVAGEGFPDVAVGVGADCERAALLRVGL